MSAESYDRTLMTSLRLEGREGDLRGDESDR